MFGYFCPCGYFQPFVFDVSLVLSVYCPLYSPFFSVTCTFSHIRVLCPPYLSDLSVIIYLLFFYLESKITVFALEGFLSCTVVTASVLKPLKKAEGEPKKKDRSGEEVKACNHEQMKETF